jgi:hypothetical protein
MRVGRVGHILDRLKAMLWGFHNSKTALVHYWDTDIRHLGRSMNVQG